MGLYSITATKEVNATTSIPSFTRGTTDPVVVTSTKGDQGQPSQVVLSATSMSGCTTQTSFSF